MAEIQKVSLVQSKPGIRRDGTNLDGENYSDGKWVRFQRGRPKKMGGYSRSSSFLSGPVRDVQVWSRGQLNNVFTFSGHQIEVTQIDENGSGSSITRVTPLADFTGNDEYLWSTDTMFDAAAGSEATIVLAVPTKTLSNIDDFTEHSLYFGLADGSAEFEKVADVNAVASGGVFVTSPYAVLYGSDGKVTWSNANEPQNYTTGDAATARVTGSKIVQGHALRSGSGASGLLWALDSVIKMEYIGGNAIFRFSKVGVSSILAQNSVIEYDGVFYWIGIDRFLTSNGATVAEVPNDMNLNWFFDNLNYAQRQKIWAMKIPRFGEIWWFFPRGDATECTHAIILNLREQCWYDCELARSAGFYSQVFRYPIMFGSDNNRNRSVVITVEAGSVSIGDVVSGGSSGATGVVVSFISDTEVIVELTSPIEFEITEELTTSSQVDPGDLYWDDVVLLLHLDNDVVDVKGNVVTNSGFTFTSDSPFSGYALYTDHVVTPFLGVGNLPGLLFGTSDYTIEFFYKHDTWIASGIYFAKYGPSSVNFFSFGTAGFYLFGGAVISYAGLSANVWRHIALVRASGVATVFVDGVSIGSVADTNDYTYYVNAFFQPTFTGGSYYDQFDELRITSVARYTADFTAPIQPFHNG